MCECVWRSEIIAKNQNQFLILKFRHHKKCAMQFKWVIKHVLFTMFRGMHSFVQWIRLGCEDKGISLSLFIAIYFHWIQSSKCWNNVSYSGLRWSYERRLWRPILLHTNIVYSPLHFNWRESTKEKHVRCFFLSIWNASEAYFFFVSSLFLIHTPI